MSKIFVLFFIITSFSPKKKLTDIQKEISTLDQLKNAIKLSKYGDTIFIANKAKIDLTDESPLVLPSGIILYGNNEESEKPFFFTKSFATNPLFICKGNNIEINGVRIKGNDSKIKQEKILEYKIKKAKEKKSTIRDINLIYVYGLPNSVGIKIYGKNIKILNCEIYNWSHAGIYIYEGATVKVANCYIYKNQRIGLGYGILVQGKAEIYNNIFDYNRHAIASSGKSTASYHAHHNICLKNSTIQSHIFDVHGGVDRKDGTNIAGEKFEVNDNIFFVENNYEVFRIRGVSIKETKVYNNTLFFNKSLEKSKMIRQFKGKDNFYASNNKMIFVK